MIRGRLSHAPMDLPPAERIMDRTLVIIAAALGFIAVAAGAFGAHALRDSLSPRDLEIFETAVRYQMYHAFALFVVAWLLTREVSGAGAAGWAFLAGTTIFSGSLYLMVFTGQRWLGAITPIGGVALIAGWLLVMKAGSRLV